MGQKVNPTGFRLGQAQTWTSRWFATRDEYRQSLREDVRIRKYLRQRLREAAVTRIEVERSASALTITLHTAKPGMVIGRGGQGVETLQRELQEKVLGKKMPIQLNIQEIDQPNLSAALAVQNISADISKRIPFRRAIRQAMNRLVKSGAAGAKVEVAGRLDGAEIARTEKMSHGTIPLHTIRADVDYSRGVAPTTYGVIGIKVWVYRGEGAQVRNGASKPDSRKRGRSSRGSRAVRNS